ncbi:cytochrome P450 3A41-like isoform X2 [Dermacentor albipictus]|uniref:cytochrome P450 3A41-like isoform X2 n=1 Tax=Dermacentor albipictus TaxID=60249 RepID=UPI0031FBA934
MHLAVFLLFAVVLLYLVRLVKRTFSFWEGKGVAHLSLAQYVGVLYDTFTKPLPDVVRSNHLKYGKLYGSYQGFVPCLVVGDPDVLSIVCAKDFKSFVDRTEREVTGNALWDNMLLNMSSDMWKDERVALSPAFTPSKLKLVFPKFLEFSERLRLQFIEEAKQRNVVEVQRLFEQCSMDGMAAFLFGLDLYACQTPDHPLVTCCNGFFSAIGGWKVVMLYAMSRVFKMLPIEFPSTYGSQQVLNFAKLMVEKRLASNERHNDVLQLCLDTVVEMKNRSGQKLTESEMKDVAAEIMVFFIAGSDGVAIALTFTAYNLALSPEYQDRLVEEIDEAVSKGMTFEALNAMPLLEAAVKESLRMYTPDSFLTRRCNQETTLYGIDFKPGMCIEIPLTGVHYNPEFHPDPYTFKPERFLPENKDLLKPYSFLAFGAGPRNCIGLRVALVQAKSVLAGLLRDVRFERCADTQVPVKFVPRRLLLEPSPAVKLRVVPRHSTARS